MASMSQRICGGKKNVPIRHPPAPHQGERREIQQVQEDDQVDEVQNVSEPEIVLTKQPKSPRKRGSWYHLS